jgi:hypothetical protein
MSEEIKTEGEFKIKKQTPKKLNKVDQVTKVTISDSEPATATEPEVTKVFIANETETTDAIQEQNTNESLLGSEGSQVGLQEVVQGNEESKIVTSQEEEVTVINEITEEEIRQETTNLTKEANDAIRASEYSGKPLPENIEKLISFMEETGGDINDYVRLNADYSNINNETLLKEYYKKTRPHLDNEEIEFLMEDNFEYDEELDEERDIRKKKLAFKEEVAKARTFLDGLKSKYYEEIKLRPGITQDQQKANDFFNRYNEEQQMVELQHSKFKDDTKNLFNQDFKGFDFNLGDKSFRYGVANKDVVADKQSNITNLVKKFLNDKGDVVDLKGYHKAMYAADNVDTIAKHFYEQGKADAIKEVVAKSNNISTEPRQASSGELFVGGMRVKAVNGVDTSKLRIQQRKF